MQTKRKSSLQELVTELQSENLQKRDMVIPAKCLTMENGKLKVFNCGNSQELEKILSETGIHSTESADTSIALECMETADQHIAEKLGIPNKYYQRMREDSIELLDNNVAHWLDRSKNNYLLRTFVDKEQKQGFARALLSDRFKTIDNYDILLTVLEAVRESGLNIQIDADSCDLSEKRMYVRFICPEVEIQAPEILKNYRPDGKPNEAGTGIISGFVISNSEVGHGSFSISPRAVVLACRNGMVRPSDKFAQRHLGAKMDEYESINWSQETKQKNLELILNQVKDYIKRFTSEEYLGLMVRDTIEKGSKELQNPMDCIKAVTQSLEISEDKQNSILNFFIKSGDLTGFGVQQAITLYAGKTENPDEQYELEEVAANILDNITVYDRPLAKKSTKSQAKLN